MPLKSTICLFYFLLFFALFTVRPVWKQPDISVEVDKARLKTSRVKKGCVICELLYYPSIECESAFTVYWNGVGAAGFSCTEMSIWEFNFWGGGGCRQGGNSMIMCEWDAPEGHSWHYYVHLYAFVSFRRLPPKFQFSLSAVTLGIYLDGSTAFLSSNIKFQLSLQA